MYTYITGDREAFRILEKDIIQIGRQLGYMMGPRTGSSIDNPPEGPLREWCTHHYVDSAGNTKLALALRYNASKDRCVGRLESDLPAEQQQEFDFAVDVAFRKLGSKKN